MWIENETTEWIFWEVSFSVLFGLLSTVLIIFQQKLNSSILIHLFAAPRRLQVFHIQLPMT